MAPDIGPDVGKELARRLEELMLDQTQFMIVDCVDRPYYIQFLPTRRGELYCEAVGNKFLEPDHWVDMDQELTLIGLGWSSPTPNFGQLWDEPIPFTEVGDLMARTLGQVFGASDISDITFTYGMRAFESD